MNETKEPQYNACFETRRMYGEAGLGLMTNHTWHMDPRRLAFVLSRYKFVAKMFAGFETVLEVGCGDGFPARLVAQTVGELAVSDFDPTFLREAEKQGCEPWPYETLRHNFVDAPLPRKFRGIYSLDVLEHIVPENMPQFLGNLVLSLQDNGAAIFGMPSIHSQEFASPQSKIGHVNCQDLPQLKANLGTFFSNVFVFSMNDEVVHTGFEKMSHYFLALCTGPQT